jgi:hypothetical protein
MCVSTMSISSPISKYLLIGVSSLIVCACSSSTAPETREPVEVSSLTAAQEEGCLSEETDCMSDFESNTYFDLNTWARLCTEARIECEK